MSRPYFNIFYICGQSPFNPLNKSSRIFRAVVATLTALIAFTSVVAIVAQFYLSPFFGVTDSTIACLFIISELVTTLSVYMQNRFYGANMQILWSKLEVIEKSLLQSFNEPPDVLQFKQMFRPYFLLNLVMLFAHCSIKYMIISRYTHLLLQTSILSLQFFSLLANLHMLFYVTVVHYFLKLVSKYMILAFHNRVADLVYSNISGLVEYLVRCKALHYKIWEATQFVNDHFGWSLAAICIQNFIDVTYALYWIFLYSQRDGDVYLAIRK